MGAITDMRTVGRGNKSVQVTTAAAVLASSDQGASFGTWLSAPDTNTEAVIIGFASTVTAPSATPGTAAATDGIPIAAGAPPLFINVDPSRLYAIAPSANQTLCALWA